MPSPTLSIGGAIYYSPNLLNYHKASEYYEINAKYVIPSSYFAKDWGAYISGAYGRFNVDKGATTFSSGAAAPFTGFSIPSYTTWNAGLAFTYKVFTLDLRYSDTSLNGTGASSSGTRIRLFRPVLAVGAKAPSPRSSPSTFSLRS